MVELHIVPLADCPPLDERVEAAIEKAYRRGYHQGAWEAADLLTHDVRETAVLRWIDRLYMWRLKGSRWRVGQRVKIEFPPVCRRPTDS